MNKACKIRVYGRVQGVWFRAYTQRKAQELDIKGFVRNEADGTVYIEAEGEENAMKAFIEWCQEGPPLAKVERIEVEPLKEVPRYDGFSIRR